MTILSKAVSRIPRTRPTSATRWAVVLLVVQATIAGGGIVLFLIGLGTFFLGLSGRLTDDAFLAVDLVVIVGYPVIICTALAVRGLLRGSNSARAATVVWCVLATIVGEWGLLIAGRTPSLFPFDLSTVANLAAPFALALPIVIVPLLFGRHQRHMFPEAPPRAGPESQPHDSARRLRVVALVVLYAAVVVVLTGLAFPRAPRLADLENSPEAQLRYPGAAAVSVTGTDFGPQGIGEFEPASLQVEFGVSADSPTMVAAWYRQQLASLGYQYAGCFLMPVPVGPDTPDYAFTRGSNHRIDVGVEPDHSTLYFTMTVGPDLPAPQATARGQPGTC